MMELLRFHEQVRLVSSGSIFVPARTTAQPGQDRTRACTTGRTRKRLAGVMTEHH